jgi:signal transduction histidine kinase
MSASPWTLALAADGELVAAHGGASSDWIGKHPTEWRSAPPELRRAAIDLVDDHRRARGAKSWARVEASGIGPVELLVVDGVPLHRSATDLASVLTNALAALERQAREDDVVLRVEIDSLPRAVVLDPEKIAWAVTSLVGSSLRHVRSGGTIDVHATWDGRRREITIAVTDDGPGIPDDVRDRLFRRASGESHAVGLTLGVVRDVVSAHGGSIEVATSTDAIDHGTAITLHIPTT